MKTLYRLLAVIPLLGACAPLPPPAPFPAALRGLSGEAPRTHVQVDSARREVVLFAGPFRIPAASGEEHHGAGHHGEHHEDGYTGMLRLDWPVEGWIRGFDLSITDARGNPLPRSLLHHLIAVNFDRRQMVYSAAERLFGLGKETEDVTLPRALGVPLEKGQRIGVYAAWGNDTGRDLDGVFLRVAMPWTPASRKPRLEVLPFYLDVNYHTAETNAYDLPPGRSTRSYEFRAPAGGRMVAVGGHLHDHGVEVRLEDAETGKVLVRLKGHRDGDGTLLRLDRRIFLLPWSRPRLVEGHRYRVVGVYDNPTPDTLPGAAMAHLVGLFAPDDLGDWPRIDPHDPEFARDVEALPEAVGKEMRGAARRSPEHRHTP